MKKLFDFVYCSGTFSPQTIWYRVAIGTSQRDRAALRRLRRVASQSPRCVLLAPHDAQLERVRHDIARATFPRHRRPSAAMRVKYIDVLSLARFCVHAPLALLNSSRIDTPMALPSFDTAIPVNVKNLK